MSSDANGGSNSGGSGKGFLSSTTGLLAALAGFLTALTGLIVAVRGCTEIKDDTKVASSPQSTVVMVPTTILIQPPPTPIATTQPNPTVEHPMKPDQPRPVALGPPEDEEWRGLREVMVTGSTRLGCETKVLRNWLLVRCDGTKQEEFGDPIDVVIERGGNDRARTYARNGVTTLLTPYTEGTDLVTKFSWTRGTYRLVVRWPFGSERPIEVGRFENLPAPSSEDYR